MPRSRIELLPMDFQSNALPLSYQGLKNNTNNKKA